MPKVFEPNYTISSATASALMSIEAVNQEVSGLPITSKTLASLRETARLYSTHYSTMIEGNRLERNQVAKVIEGSGHFPGRERDEGEVKGYYAALEELERVVSKGSSVTEAAIGRLHARVMANGRKTRKPTPYRDGQNVIRDSSAGVIVYLPPEAKDVPVLMGQLVTWIKKQSELPVPLIASIAHYQIATIHPWYDGNGRTARLLTTLVLHLGGYGLKGLYSLEEYYARDLKAYYNALSLGPSHNYYDGRAKANITPWIDYFIAGMANSFNNVKARANQAATDGMTDSSGDLRELDPRQRKALSLFLTQNEITSIEVQSLFEIKPRTARIWCADWVEAGFLSISDPSRKARKYRLAERYRGLVD